MDQRLRESAKALPPLRCPMQPLCPNEEIAPQMGNARREFTRNTDGIGAARFQAREEIPCKMICDEQIVERARLHAPLK